MQARFIIYLLILVIITKSEAWRRRRRRRWTPPPPQNCVVSQWSSWSTCSQQCHIGTQRRTRTITTSASWGGSCPYYLSDQRSCGVNNGGCDQLCNYGVCSCQSGYTQSGSKCYDIDECAPNGGKGPCSHICTNHDGWYSCQCPTGYYLATDSRTCHAFDCSSPASLFNPCPQDSYSDHISSVCRQVNVNCLQGTTYNEQCSLTCPQDYALAKIFAQQNKKFGEDYSKVDFFVTSTLTCQKTRNWQTSNVWDVLDSDLRNYYCRRRNDPPGDLLLNGTVLLEHTPVNSIIGTLSSHDAQPGQTFMYTVQQPNELLVAQGEKLINIWDNPVLNGNVSLSQGQYLAVKIRSTDDGMPPMWLEKTFQITVQNVNDPPKQVNLSNSVVFENATLGTVIGELTAVDGDDPPNTHLHANFKWGLINDANGKFGISTNKITVAQNLVPGLYKIIVSCTDFGNPAEQTTEDFIINVINVNDIPQALMLTSTTVHETAPVNTIVGQLVAIDKDGDNISFDISQSDVVTLNKFDIANAQCANNGQGLEKECKVNVTVKAPLNYEEKSWYRLNVKANDSQTQVFKMFNIEIINDNEAPTTITLTGSHTVLENSVAGTVIGQFVVTDPDNAKSPSHQSHTCLFGVSHPRDESYFIISTGLVLKVKGAQQIDYENMKTLSFSVICTDSGHPSKSLSTSFFISVKDVNEAPVNLTLSSTNVDENSPLGTSVGSLSSDDPDQPGGVHTYTIVGPTGVPFTIGGTNNRVLLVNGTLDHETKPIVLVIIRATDNGGLFVKKTFKITINDINDPPSNLSLEKPSMEENSAERVLISAIILTDQDGDLPSCRLLDDAGGRVSVVGTNLVAGPTLTDYESAQLPSTKDISIKLNCSDGHGMFIAKHFTIKVMDVNEAPSDIALSATSVDENRPDTIVGKVTVTDSDIGQQHRCTVHDRAVSDSGRTSKFFTVDASLNLRTLTGLNFEAHHSLDIWINCSDIVVDSLFKTQLFTIFVKDVNEAPIGLCNAPIIIGMKGSVGAVIAELQGDDPDNEIVIQNNPSNQSVIVRNKQQLTYSLSPQQNSWPFGIKTNSLFKSAEISQAQNFTIGVEVKDDGIIVGSFSSMGYKYIKSTPLSAVLNCTIIVSEYQPTDEILLQPSEVSITANDGSLVGTLTTMTQNPGEKFVYELVDEAQLPFSVIGDRFVVFKKDGLDFHVSSAEEALIPVAIISRGNMSAPVRGSFYVRIIDDRPHPVDMCLNPHTVHENQPSGITVGQLTIDDSSSPIFSCGKQRCCNDYGRNADYECKVDTPKNNLVVPQLRRNVSALFRLDDRDRLVTKVPLQYNDFKESNGTVHVHFSCYQVSKPLHFVGKSLQVVITDCDSNGVCPDTKDCPVCHNGGSCLDVIDGYSCQCISGYTGVHCDTDIDDCQGIECQNGGTCQDGIASFTCQCAVGFSGTLCERQVSLCGDCTGNTLCVTFLSASIRCLGTQHQIPVLVNEPQISPERKIELEEEIGAILDANRNDANRAISRKRRALSNYFYVEVLQTVPLVTQRQSLLIITALDARNAYSPLPAPEACRILANSVRQCVESCDVLQLARLPCQGSLNTNIGKPSEDVSAGGLGSGGIAGIAVVVFTLLIATLFAAVFYYRRKYKKAKNKHNPVRYQSNTEDVDFSNPVYGNNGNALSSGPSRVEWAEKLRKESDGLVLNNLNPTSVVKCNDIQVSDNPLYHSPGSAAEPGAPSPNYAKAVDIPSEDETEGAKKTNKEDHTYAEPKDVTLGGASKNQYENPPSKHVSHTNNSYTDPKGVTPKGSLNPCYEMSPPPRVSHTYNTYAELKDVTFTGVSNPRYVKPPPVRTSFVNKLDDHQEDDGALGEGTNPYFKSAKAKVRASNASQIKRFRRQRSGEKEAIEEENVALKKNEVPPSFENPFYRGSSLRDQDNFMEDPTYATIPALQECRPCLPPRTQQRSYDTTAEEIQVQEDNVFEKVNFGDTEA